MKLDVNIEKISIAREYAKDIVSSFKPLMEGFTTVTIERTVTRLMGIDGCLKDGEPYPNVVVDHLHLKGALGRGVAFWIANGMLALDLTAQELAVKIAEGTIDLTGIAIAEDHKTLELINSISDNSLQIIREQREFREKALQQFGARKKPAIYVIVATGNIYDDVVQAKAAVRQGADIIAVIRSTAQSLLDYVPYGATKSGFGGTYATQENFRIMRKELDAVGSEIGKYIFLTNYASGLCMPEIAVMGALERLDIMLNDAMYGILFRDINMKRTFIDQYFSRMINAYAGIEIQTGEDNYLTTSDAIEKAYTVTASQLLNEQFALLSGIPENKMGLGHAFEINPQVKNSILYETAHAMLTKILFPASPVKYMPPTKFASTNIFRTYLLNGMFNMVAKLTGQDVQLLGMLTEAVHTPHLADRALAIENAEYVFNAVGDLSEEFELKKDSFINQRANQVLDEAIAFLKTVREMGLMKAMAAGSFANIKRDENGGKGLQGVIKKECNYLNPFMDKMKQELFS